MLVPSHLLSAPGGSRGLFLTATGGPPPPLPPTPFCPTHPPLTAPGVIFPMTAIRCRRAHLTTDRRGTPCEPRAGPPAPDADAVGAAGTRLSITRDALALFPCVR